MVYSALQLQLDPIIDKGTLVEYPENCAYWLNQKSSTFEADYAALVQRMNYLAKEHTKIYRASSRNIGYNLS
ncbi:inovirus-type Gp2 protein [Providencia sp. 21OH12SH02B-Prov]|uniref:YagK/YfjJ domain-containing protein n=1 Tax=Providencia sp. 21OH12SH02B-Prov TaxID=3015951 RepID=UPI0022B70E10|nr:inovirus-type Gp2 protein [Providencia sp. 21OH12SH02B-Prov]WBA58350.1 inovirus-type Gp2 protein [Providencia sp. 21OH12SH02B-Prov]